MFSLRATIIIGFFLVGPFALKNVRKTEMYPAIILPGGATVLNIADRFIEMDYVEIYAVTTDRKILIDKNRFFSPIPSQYSNRIYGRDFGLNDYALSEDQNIIDVSGTTNSNVEELKQWIDRKLKKFDIQDTVSSLYLETIRVKLSIHSGDVVSKKTVNGKVIKLR